jgi:hypothetical protein
MFVCWFVALCSSVWLQNINNRLNKQQAKKQLGCKPVKRNNRLASNQTNRQNQRIKQTKMQATYKHTSKKTNKY